MMGYNKILLRFVLRFMVFSLTVIAVSLFYLSGLRIALVASTFSMINTGTLLFLVSVIIMYEFDWKGCVLGIHKNWNLLFGGGK